MATFHRLTLRKLIFFAAVSVLLGACGGTALDTEMPKHFSSNMKIEDAIEAMNALGADQPRKFKRVFSVQQGCVLEIKERDMFRSTVDRIALGESEVRVNPRQEKNLFDVLMLPQAAAGHQVSILHGLLWFEAHQVKWLVEHIADACGSGTDRGGQPPRAGA